MKEIDEKEKQELPLKANLKITGKLYKLYNSCPKTHLRIYSRRL